MQVPAVCGACRFLMLASRRIILPPPSTSERLSPLPPLLSIEPACQKGISKVYVNDIERVAPTPQPYGSGRFLIKMPQVREGWWVVPECC